MIIKGQLLSATNLNNAYISKTDTNAQSINSTLTISGGALTLKNSIISDNASSQYMQIDPQGNKVILYDGVNNQRLDIYSSSGSESTYLTTVNGTKSIGILDVSSAIDHLEIATNSSKPVVFGAEIKTTGNTLGIQLDARDAPLITRGWDAFTSGKYSGIGKWGLFMEPSTLTFGVNASNGNFQFARYSANSAIVSTPLYINTSDNVGIGTTSPSQKLDVNGNINIGGGYSLLFGTYGGGLYMSDSTWIRTAGSKSFYHNSGEFRTDGTLEVGSNGATFSVPNGGALNYMNGKFVVNTNGSLAMSTAKTQNTGINLDGLTIDTIANGGNIALGGLNQLRFGTSTAWDYNQWAGIKYDSANHNLWIGGPSSPQFSSNSAPPNINILFTGVSNVGVGTASPSYALDVYGDINASSSLRIGANYMIAPYSSNTLGITKSSGSAGAGVYIGALAVGYNYGSLGSSIDNTGVSLFNGNVGIKTSSPQQALDVNGSIRMQNSVFYSNQSYVGFESDGGGALPIKAGSLAITSSYGNSAPTNGLYVQGAVGIGTTSPTSMFQVNESGTYAMNMYTSGDHLYLQTVGSSGAYPYIGWITSGGTRGAYLGSGVQGSYLMLGLENNNNFIINGGKVGIGTTGPSQTLDVAGNIQTNSTFISNGNADVIQLLGTGNAVKTIRYDNSNLRIWNSGSGELMTFTQNTRVGINQPSPSYTLDVNGNMNVSGLLYSLGDNQANFQVGNDSQLWDINVANTMGVYGVQNSAVGGIKLGSTGPTLYGSGNMLGIGTTSPAYTLDVNGSIRIQGSNGIYSSHINDFYLFDHGNGNVTLSAVGGSLYLGYHNTNSVLMSATLVTSDASKNIIGTDGTLYYQGTNTDSRYALKSGDTMSSDLSFSNQNNGIGLTIVANGTTPANKTSGSWVTGGEDYAGLGALNNVAVQTWYGFSVSPTISGQTIPQGKPAFSVNARTGDAMISGGVTASSATINGTATFNGNLQINNGGFINGIAELYGGYGTIAKSTDEWLRLNDDGSHTNGVYFGSSIVRTDGQFQVGGNGSYFNVDPSGNTLLTGQLTINRPSSHLHFQENGSNTWHLESVSNNLQIVRTGQAVRAVFSDAGHFRLDSYYPGWSGWHIQLGLNASGDSAIWHEASDMAMGFHTNGSVYWMTGASTASGGAYVMQLDTTTNKLWVGGNELMQKNKNVSFGTGTPTGGSSGDIYIQI